MLSAMAHLRAGAPAIGAGYGHSSFAETFPQTVGLTPAVCTGGRCGTLYVLLGDSIDREVARRHSWLKHTADAEELAS